MDDTDEGQRRSPRAALIVAIGLVLAIVATAYLLRPRPTIAEIKARCGAFEGDDLSFGDHAGGGYGTLVVVRRSGQTWAGLGPARWGTQHRGADDEVEGDLSVRSDGTATFVATDGTSAEMTPTDHADGNFACAI